MECLEKHFEGSKEVFIGSENLLGVQSDIWAGPGQFQDPEPR